MFKCAHVNSCYMLDLYGRLVARFVIYLVCSYAVSLAFIAVCYSLMQPAMPLTWDALTSCSPKFLVAVVYMLAVGYFALRDGLEAQASKLADVFAALPPKQK